MRVVGLWRYPVKSLQGAVIDTARVVDDGVLGDRQPGLDSDLDVFRTLARHHAAGFGVWSVVVATGTVTLGDDATVLARAPART